MMCRHLDASFQPGLVLRTIERGRIQVSALILSFVVIFVAEVGGKSQLMAMTFATRFRYRTVLIGITIATAVVHLVSAAIGGILEVTLRRTSSTSLPDWPSLSSGCGLGIGALLGKALQNE